MAAQPQLVSGVQAIKAAPTQIRCRYCGDLLTLNPDSMEARETRLDPYQQMRRHVATRHPLQVVKHAQACGFLLDMLFFENDANPQKWRQQIAALVDYILQDSFVRTK
jgi:hypothetical protein